MSELSSCDDDVFGTATSSHASTLNGNLLNPQLAAAMSPRSPRSSLIKHGSSRRDASAKKTVSFGSMPTDKKISNVQDCLAFMQGGTDLIKVRSSARRYRRHFSLDADLSHFRWTPTNKKPHKAKIDVRDIKEIRTGRNSDAYRCGHPGPAGSGLESGSSTGYEDLPEECAFSVLWGETLESLDLLALSPDEANIWVTGLMALSAKSLNAQSDGSDMQSHDMRDQWLKDCYTEASGSKTFLDEEEFVRLAVRLCDRLLISRLRQKIKEVDSAKEETERGQFTCEDFVEIHKDIATRPEVYFLMVRYANKDYLSLDDFRRFLEAEQGMAGIAESDVKSIMRRFEPSTAGQAQHRMAVDGFTAYLLSDECDVFDPLQRTLCQDMSQPLNHYFIASSNNTYLISDQLKGASSVDGFFNALKRGARYIKVDVWEEEGQLVIYRGSTTTSRLPVAKALRAIREYAFEKTDFPLIIDLENHVDGEKQNELASLLKSNFGSVLWMDELGTTELPSPDSMRGRILLKGKRLPLSMPDDSAGGDVSEEDESFEASRTIRGKGTPRPTHKRRIYLGKDLSGVMSGLNSCYVHDHQSLGDRRIPWDVLSMSESLATRLVSSLSDDLIALNKRFLSRVYPSGVRVDSSNFNPQEFWNCGCQIVCMNYQTRGLMMDLQEGKFSANGGCGYVLKPAGMRDEVNYFSLKDGIPGVAPQVLHMKIISAQHLPRPRGSDAKGDSCDPYVVVEIFGIPGDCAEERTRTVHNESFNPMFDETFEFHIAVPELALVRLLVLDDEHIGDDFIGQYTIPFECLQTGYRHLTLLSIDGLPLEGATLFVHLAITNRRGGGKAHKRGRSVMKKKPKVQTGIKLLGLKSIDDIFKASNSPLTESIQLRNTLENAVSEFQNVCGLPPSANLKQGFRVLSSRVQSTITDPPLVLSVFLHEGNKQPTIDLQGPSSDSLTRSFASLDRVISCCETLLSKSDGLNNKLSDVQKRVMECYDDLGTLCLEAGLKEQKATRASENFSWNIRILKGQSESMTKAVQEAKDHLVQVQDASLQAGVGKECPDVTCPHFMSIV